ncbi:MAG: insulinase family protein [Candidatus Calescibacterium sp.]|nr:insulinase family protein [Candidatus Calescibacterium sp.]
MRGLLLNFILFSLIFSQAYAITIDMGEIRRKSKEVKRVKKQGDIRFDVISYKLKNGLRVYIVPKRDGSGNSAVFLWIKSGASDEPEDFFGGAHILEHIVFKGSPERGVSEVSDAIEKLGGYINAWTSYDNTVYWVLIPSEHITVPFEVLADIVWNPAFSDEEFEREKEVVLEEWRRGQDIPSYRLYHRFFEQIYKSHPYGHPVIGYENTIKSITKDMVLKFHSSFYSTENAFLVVVGDFDPKEISKKIQKIFGKVKAGSKPRKLDVRSKPDFIGPKAFFITGKEKEAQVMLGFLGYPYSITYSVYFDIISDILEKRLVKRLRIDDVIVNSVDVDYWSPPGVGMFEIFYSVKGENIKKAFDIIQEELLKIKSFGISDKELEATKNSILSDFYKNLQSVRSTASLVGYSVQLSDDPYAIYEYLEILRTVDGKRIQQVLEDIIDESRFLAGIYVNEDEKGFAEEIVSQKFSFKERQKLPFSLVDEKVGIRKYVSQNGVRILFKKIEGTGTISVVSVFPGGNIFYSSKPGIPNLTAGTIVRGTKSKSADMILDEIKAIGGNISASASFDAFSVSSSFLANQYERGLQIFFDVILNPSFDEKEIEKVREDIMENLRTRYDNPQVQAVDEFLKILFDGTPYSLPDGISEEFVKSASRSDLVEFWNYVNSDPEKIVLAVVGDFKDENEILRAFYFYGDKIFTKKKESSINFPQKVKCNFQGSEKRVKREGNQVHILVGFCGPSILEKKENLAFQIISSAVSGMGGRIFMNLREKKGLAYVAAPVRRSFISSGFFGGYIASAPQKLEESLVSLKEEIKNISQIQDDEFERGKNLILGSIRRELQSNSSWAWVLAQDEFLGRGFDYYLKVQQEIKSMSKEEAIAIFKEYFGRNNLSVLVLGP